MASAVPMTLASVSAWRCGMADCNARYQNMRPVLLRIASPWSFCDASRLQTLAGHSREWSLHVEAMKPSSTLSLSLSLSLSVSLSLSLSLLLSLSLSFFGSNFSAWVWACVYSGTYNPQIPAVVFCCSCQVSILCQGSGRHAPKLCHFLSEELTLLGTKDSSNSRLLIRMATAHIRNSPSHVQASVVLSDPKMLVIL